MTRFISAIRKLFPARERGGGGSSTEAPAGKGGNIYRHGDVILQRVEAMPPGLMPKTTTILARGEATGHSHRIADASGVELFDGEGVGYLSVSAESATLVHDEHDPIQLPRGFYRFWQQREYAPKEIRTIID